MFIFFYFWIVSTANIEDLDSPISMIQSVVNLLIHILVKASLCFANRNIDAIEKLVIDFK